jgi:sulfoxide reductase heme-binding subunit YedZ
VKLPTLGGYGHMLAELAPSRIRELRRRGLNLGVFVASLIPLVWLVAQGLTGGLGANPIEALIRGLGDWALRFLLIALAVTPIRIVTGWVVLARLRRMLGLFAFFYAVLHMLSYVGLDHLFNWPVLWEDITKRIYIIIGMAAFLMLLLLAVTSTDGMVKRLGGLNWRRLHRIVYVAAIAAVTHYFLMIKAGYTDPVTYAVILALLFSVRLYKKWG